MPKNVHDPTQPYTQRHTVTIAMDSLTAELFAPIKLRRIQEERPGSLARIGPVLEEHYVVTTRRRDLDWEYTINVGADEWRVPPQVIDRIIADRDLIMKSQRSERGRNHPPRRRKDQREETYEESEE